MIARVVDEEHTYMFAKAGLTMGALAPDAARIILDTRPDGNVEFMVRLADGGAMSFIGGADTTFPVWPKLVRAGDQFIGSISSDGSAKDVTAPAAGTYTFTMYANASRPGAWIGVNVNGAAAQSAPVQVRGAARTARRIRSHSPRRLATRFACGYTRRPRRAQR